MNIAGSPIRRESCPSVHGITEPCGRVLDVDAACTGSARHGGDGCTDRRGDGRRSTATTIALTAAAIAAAWVGVGITAPAAPPTGRIEGVVRLMAPDDRPIVSGAYPGRRVNKTAARTGEVRNVIVFLRDVPRSAALPATRLEMVQQDEAFVPRVVAITRGSTVDFPNADPFFHNVFSLSRSATFDLGRFPRGERRSRTFTQAGLIKVYCHLHSHMSASIMVFDHPHFALPAAGGAFALEDVPVGEYRLSAWHERIGEAARPIVVEAGRTLRVEFALPVESTN
jgi:plastocyanin